MYSLTIKIKWKMTIFHQINAFNLFVSKINIELDRAFIF